MYFFFLLYTPLIPKVTSTFRNRPGGGGGYVPSIPLGCVLAKLVLVLRHRRYSIVRQAKPVGLAAVNVTEKSRLVGGIRSAALHRPAARGYSSALFEEGRDIL